MDNLLLNLVVVFETRRIKGVTQLRAAEATKQLVIQVKRGKISVLILTAYISPSLAAEGTMHVRISLLTLLIVSIGSGSAESP